MNGLNGGDSALGRYEPHERAGLPTSAAAAHQEDLLDLTVLLPWIDCLLPSYHAIFLAKALTPLAIVALLKRYERVMFVSLDAWHPSGVEEAFYTTDRVCCVSLHRYGKSFFPGSGGAKDNGAAAGVNHTLNMPVSEGLNDEQVGSSPR